MKIETARFGLMELEEDHLFTFDQGIPAFEQLHQYVFVQDSEDLPFCYMQSVEQGDILFVVTDPFIFFEDYDFEIPEESLTELGLTDPKEVKVWVIVTVQGRMENATVNLLSPIVLNMTTKKGKQLILNHSPYSTRHKLLDEPAENGV